MGLVRIGSGGGGDGGGYGDGGDGDGGDGGGYGDGDGDGDSGNGDGGGYGDGGVDGYGDGDGGAGNGNGGGYGYDGDVDGDGDGGGYGGGDDGEWRDTALFIAGGAVQYVGETVKLAVERFSGWWVKGRDLVRQRATWEPRTLAGYRLISDAKAAEWVSHEKRTPRRIDA